MDAKIQYAGKEVTFLDAQPQDYIEGMLLAGQWYELKNLEYIRDLNVAGAYVDAGAFIGTHSLYFSLFCPSTRVYSFEANPRSWEKLVRNLNANGVTKCRALNVGVSDVEGHAVLREANETNRGATHLTIEDGEIEVLPIDFFQFENVKLMKIDVEGLELRVLNGAVNTLKTVEHLFVEMWSLPQSEDRGMEYTLPKVIDFTAAHGLRLVRELDDRLYHFSRS